MSVHVLIHTFKIIKSKIKKKKKKINKKIYIYKYGNTTAFTVVLHFTNVTLRQ